MIGTGLDIVNSIAVSLVDSTALKFSKVSSMPSDMIVMLSQSTIADDENVKVKVSLT